MLLKTKDVWDILLEKKEGYELKNVICTTFTLSSAIVPSILLKIIECDNKIENINSLSLTEKYMILSSKIEEAVEKLTIFSDDYIIPSYQKSTELQRLINEYCIPKTVVRIAPKTDSKCFFHPKIIMIHFMNGSENYFRCAVLSKNLTLARNVVEVVGFFESQNDNQIEQQIDVENASDELKSFFENILNIEMRDTKGTTLSCTEAKDRIGETIDALQNVKFVLLTENYENKPIAAKLMIGTPGNGLLTKYNDANMKCILKNASYWCSDSISNSFMSCYLINKPMISNLRSFRKLLDPNNLTDIPDNYYIGRSDNNSLTIHAKFLESNFQGKNVAFIGSANFTEQAFNNNYECMLMLVYEGASSEETVRPNQYSGNAFNIENKNIRIIKVKEKVDELRKEIEKDAFEEKIKKYSWEMTLKSDGTAQISGKSSLNISFTEDKQSYMKA